MKVVLGFLLFLIASGLSGMLVFLNQEKTFFILTPTFKGIYYTLPEMPLGLLVVLSFFIGFFVGYIFRLFAEFLK